jgi:hypothetical protein
MHLFRLVTLDEVGFVTVALEQLLQFVVGNARKEARVRDLVPVEVQDGQDGAVTGGIQKLVSVPACSQWTGFSFAVADYRGHDEIRVIERRAVGVRESVAEFSAFVN